MKSCPAAFLLKTTQLNLLIKIIKIINKLKQYPWQMAILFSNCIV